MKPERLVLVLSGGGMKAVAHVGVIRALHEMGRPPAEIIATSAGAIIGAMIAGGMPYERIAATVCAMRRRDMFQVNGAAVLFRGLTARSVVKADPLKQFLLRHLPEREWSKLAVPLRIVTTELETGAAAVFGSAGRTDCSVADAVYASMALPLYFPPLTIGTSRFADGGLVSVLPLDQAATITADLVVAVDVGPVAASPPAWLAPSPPLLAAHDRAMAIMMAAQRARQLEAWHADARRAPLVLIEPPVDPYGTFAFDRTVDFIEAGYRATHAAMAGLLRTS